MPPVAATTAGLGVQRSKSLVFAALGGTVTSAEALASVIETELAGHLPARHVAIASVATAL